MVKESIYKRYVSKAEPENKLEERAHFLIFSGDKMLLNRSNSKTGLHYVVSLEELNVSSIRTHYMGTFEEHPCYCVEVEPTQDLSTEMHFYDLRALYYEVAFDVFLLAGKALQIINWDKTHQFCGRCGDKMNKVQKEIAKVCPSCGLVNYTRISPAMIVGIFKDDKILLAHSAAFKGKMYSVLAGFIEAGETIEDGVRREVMEEVGLRVKNIKYFGSQSWPFSSSLMIGFTAEYESGEIDVDGDEITDAGWYDIYNLPELPLEYSIAREIIDSYIKSNTPSI